MTSTGKRVDNGDDDDDEFGDDDDNGADDGDVPIETAETSYNSIALDSLDDPRKSIRSPATATTGERALSEFDGAGNNKLLEDLPVEVARLVFSFLSALKPMGLMSVSRRMSDLVQSALQSMNLLRIPRDAPAPDLSPFKSLTELYFSSATAASIRPLSLATKPKLQFLYLSGCSELPDSELENMWAALKTLHELDLWRCQRITDVGLAGIRMLPSLRKLNLSNCPLLTNDTLSSISRLPNLQRLNIAGCVSITDLSHLTSSQKGPPLREINASSCIKVSDTGLRELACIANLRNLDLTGCVLVSATGVSSLMALKPQLSIRHGRDRTA